MKRILFASDLTERSQRAADRARFLQRYFDARLTALHVVEADLPESLRRRREQEAREVLLGSMGTGSAESTTEKAPLDVEVCAGADHEVIVSKAEDYDLIVLGTHRARAIDTFVGTTVERVLRSTDRAVLMVKNDTAGSYGRVAIAVDLSPSSQRAAAAAARLAPEAQFFLVNAHDVPFSGYMSQEEKLRASYDAETHAAMDGIDAELPAPAERRVVRIGEPVPTIRAACQEVGADLVVLATRSRARFARAILGSVAERVLADPPCDVLVVRGR